MPTRKSNGATSPECVTSLRDKLTHHYFDTDFEFVWIVLQKLLDPLGKTVEQMLIELPRAGE